MELIINQNQGARLIDSDAGACPVEIALRVSCVSLDVSIIFGAWFDPPSNGLKHTLASFHPLAPCHLQLAQRRSDSMADRRLYTFALSLTATKSA